jgi:hypothetical protein
VLDIERVVFLHEPPDSLRIHDDGLPLQIHPDYSPTSPTILPQEDVLDQQMLVIVGFRGPLTGAPGLIT